MLLFFLQKTHGMATNCFQNLQCFLTREDDLIDRNHAMTDFCYEYFKKSVCNFLYDEFYIVN